MDSLLSIASSDPRRPLQAFSEHLGPGLPGVREAGEVRGQGVGRPVSHIQYLLAVAKRQAQFRKTFADALSPDSFISLFIHL